MKRLLVVLALFALVALSSGTASAHGRRFVRPLRPFRARVYRSPGVYVQPRAFYRPGYIHRPYYGYQRGFGGVYVHGRGFSIGIGF